MFLPARVSSFSFDCFVAVFLWPIDNSQVHSFHHCQFYRSTRPWSVRAVSEVFQHLGGSSYILNYPRFNPTSTFLLPRSIGFFLLLPRFFQFNRLLFTLLISRLLCQPHLRRQRYQHLGLLRLHPNQLVTSIGLALAANSQLINRERNLARNNDVMAILL